MRRLLLQNHFIKYSPIENRLQWTGMNCAINSALKTMDVPGFGYSDIYYQNYYTSVVDTLKIPYN